MAEIIPISALDPVSGINLGDQFVINSIVDSVLTTSRISPANLGSAITPYLVSTLQSVTTEGNFTTTDILIGGSEGSANISLLGTSGAIAGSSSILVMETPR